MQLARSGLYKLIVDMINSIIISGLSTFIHNRLEHTHIVNMHTLKTIPTAMHKDAGKGKYSEIALFLFRYCCHHQSYHRDYCNAAHACACGGSINQRSSCSKCTIIQVTAVYLLPERGSATWKYNGV